MTNLELIRDLAQPASTKIILLVLDGLGGLSIEPQGQTELESAKTPHFDRLAAEGSLGQTIPIARGITPGSGPAHLGMFGYDPIEFAVGRGVLEAVGIGMRVNKGDVAARGNFCTLDSEGLITDRRAGRIPTKEAIPLVERLTDIHLENVEVEVKHVREYRFALIMRGDGLESDLEDTDPQQTGLPPHPVQALTPSGKHTAALFDQWIAEARKRLHDQPAANGLTLRGFSTDPGLPQFPEIFGLNAACVAVYPMYRGVSSLVGMNVIQFDGDTPQDEFGVVEKNWDAFDFFFVHIKKTDSKGEDGDFHGKIAVIESVDDALPDLLNLGPDVLCVTGDHATPARMRVHTWHPVPTLLWAPASVCADQQSTFGERACQLGGLGTFPAKDLMPLIMAHAGRLAKYGA